MTQTGHFSRPIVTARIAKRTYLLQYFGRVNFLLPDQFFIGGKQDVRP
jgi:hypothetical protein